MYRSNSVSPALSGPGRFRLLTACVTLASSIIILMMVACREQKTTLAVVLPETGSAGVYGTALRKGVELAAAELSAANNSSFSLAFYDSASDPARARDLLAAAFRGGATAAIGGVTSAEALAMGPVADQAARVVISPTASSPRLTGLSSYLFRLFPSDDLEANSIAFFASQTLGLEEVALVADDRAYGSGVRDAFRHAFGSYLGKVTEYPLTLEGDPATVAATVAESAPEAVFLAAYADTLAVLVSHLREAGYLGRILTTHAFATSVALEKAGPHAVGVLVPQTAFAVSQDAAQVRAFAEAFRARYDAEPSLFAAYGYDALHLLAEAGFATGGDDLRRSLRVLKMEGVTGAIAFDRQGDIERPPRIHIVADDLTLLDYETYLADQRSALMTRLEALRQNAAGRD